MAIQFGRVVPMTLAGSLASLSITAAAMCYYAPELVVEWSMLDNVYTVALGGNWCDPANWSPGFVPVEAAAAESYFDSGNRAQFGNCRCSYEPIDSALFEPRAEMLFGGPRLEAIKARLARYAS